MLNDFGRVLIEMLSNEVIPDTGLGETPAADQHMFGGSIDEILNNLEINPELRAIIYECIHAKEKVAQKEEEGYQNEIDDLIIAEKIRRHNQEQKDSGSEDPALMDF